MERVDIEKQYMEAAPCQALPLRGGHVKTSKANKKSRSVKKSVSNANSLSE